MSVSTDPWIWLLGIGMLGIFSFVIQENPIYSFFEHVYVGLGAAYGIGAAYDNVVKQAINPIMQNGKVWLIVPIILGVMAYARFFKPIGYFSRWPMAFLAGVGAGLSLYGVVNADLLAQIKANLLPLNSVNNAVLVFGVLAVLVYFFFAIDHKGPIKYTATAGRYLLMVTFGVSFGNVVMGRISLLLGCMQDIMGKWLGLL